MNTSKIFNQVKKTVITNAKMLNAMPMEAKLGMGIGVIGGFPIGRGIVNIFMGKPGKGIIDIGIGAAMAIGGQHMIDRGFDKNHDQFIEKVSDILDEYADKMEE